MSKAPAFQLYAADFYMDTNGWSVEEVGIYTRLLFHQWVNGFIPDDPARLARIAQCSLKSFPKRWRSIQFKFTPAGNGKLVNPRLEETRNEQEEYYKRQEESGRLGGLRSQEKRRIKTSTASSTASRLDSSDVPSENEPLQSSSSSLKKEIKAPLPPEKISPPKKPFDKNCNEEERHEIESLSMELCSSWPLVQKFVKDNILQAHPKSIILALQRIKDKPEITNKWKYASEVIEKESGNFRERDYVSEANRKKIGPEEARNILSGFLKGER